MGRTASKVSGSSVSVSKNLTFGNSGQKIPEELLWAYVGGNTSGNHIISAFGSSDSTKPIAGRNFAQQQYLGGAEAPFINNGEFSTGQMPRGYTTTLNTQSHNPENGYMGISCDGEYFNHRNVELNKNLEFLPNHWSNNSTANFQYTGHISGEPGYKRGITMLRSGFKIYLKRLTSMIKYYNTEFSSAVLTPGTHLTSPATAQSSAMRGGFSYNRKTDTLMMLESTSNYAGYRIHIWSGLSQKIGDDAKILQTMLAEAFAGVKGSYRYVDYTTNGAGGYAGTSGTWGQAPTIVACDDGSAWITYHHTSYLQLFSFNGDSAVTFKRDIRGNNSYGTDQGGSYRTKHQMSEDQSRVAIYVPYYYYLTGYMIFYCSTKSAKSNNYRYKSDTTTSNKGLSICPIGGDAFGVIAFSNSDLNSTSPYLQKFSHADEDMNGSIVPERLFQIQANNYSGSTNYSGSWLTRIRHDLVDSDEYKEGLLNLR